MEECCRNMDKLFDMYLMIVWEYMEVKDISICVVVNVRNVLIVRWIGVFVLFCGLFGEFVKMNVEFVWRDVYKCLDDVRKYIIDWFKEVSGKCVFELFIWDVEDFL